VQGQGVVLFCILEHESESEMNYCMPGGSLRGSSESNNQNYCDYGCSKCVIAQA
jgi:hypothetical protein